MAEKDERLYSQTIDRRHKGHGFVNILAHDPPTDDELENAPSMHPDKHFETVEEASEHAANTAQEEYDNQRKDPNSNWYAGSAFQGLGK